MQWKCRGMLNVLAATTLAGTLGLGAAGAAIAAPADTTARVYVSLPRQGQGAPSAALIAKGLRTALAERDGTVAGRKVRIVWMDDAKGPRWNRARVVANARRAAADPSAIAYVGEGNSEATAVSMPIVNRAGLVHLSPVSTAEALTDATTAGRYQPAGVQTFFRPIPGDARQATALLSAVRRSGARKRVVVVDDGTLYGRGLTQGVRAGAARARVGIAGQHVADRDGRRIEAMVRHVLADRPTAVVYGGSPSSNAAAVLRALHRAAPRLPLFGGDALAHDGFVRQLGDAQKRVRFTTPAAHVDSRKHAGRGLGKRPDPFAVFAYNGMEALLGAIERAEKAGTATRESVRQAVFDGSIQRGLSGAWKISDRGDSVYGVYDIMRAAGGRTVSPIDRLSDQLVRQEQAKATAKRAGKARKNPSTRASASPRAVRVPAGDRAVSVLPGVGIAPAATLDSMDIETALMMIQAERTRLLDAQLATQLKEVQERNAQVGRLNELLVRLNAVVARFPAAAEASVPLSSTGTAASYSALVDDVRVGQADAGVTLELAADAGAWTRGQLETAVAEVRGMVDSLGNVQQIDMIRLQSLTNKRNEAFAVMAEFAKKMQESRDSIIGNIR